MTAPKSNSDSSSNDTAITVQSETPSFEKVEEFSIKIQGGLLDNLGIKMYRKLGKVLVEFAANAFDSDSPSVDINFDFDKIHTAREQVLASAKSKRLAATDGKSDKARIVDDPLPADIKVTISDFGHGMTPKGIKDGFLPLNRNRRRNNKGEEVNNRSEAGKRFVMGRKGIGKLSAFGAAGVVTVRSKRAGQPFWTTIVLTADELLNAKDLGTVSLKHEYQDAPEDVEKHGTIVELSSIKCSSAGFTIKEITDALNEAFYPIKKEEFAIRINGTNLEKQEPLLAYIWPETLKKGEYATDTLKHDDWGEISFNYRVQFREKSLPAEKRGAYIYAKKRLASDPSLLDLDTGTHNFLANTYMECIVECDDLDNLNIDVIGTNRSELLENNELVRDFRARITAIMRDAVKANAEYKEAAADMEIDTAPKAQRVRDILHSVPSKQKKYARQIARLFVRQYGADSSEFEQVAPLILGVANAGEVLVDLIKVSQSPSTVVDIAEKLVRLNEIERSDALKVFRGRRNGLVGLRTLISQGEDSWIKGPQTEKKLHLLLKQGPWLIRPELAEYVASDVTMKSVLDRLSSDLKIDNYAGVVPELNLDAINSASDKDAEETDQTLRPDLVSLIGNSSFNRVLIIELKSTALPMRIEHLHQLQGYMTDVEQHLKREFPSRTIVVEGILIGAMPGDSGSRSQRHLLSAVNRRGPTELWDVIGLNELLLRAETVHRSMISTLEKEEELEPVNDDNEAGSSPPKAAALAPV